MNKGLELIEAPRAVWVERAADRDSRTPTEHRALPVEYVDGSMLAQLSAPDMRTPIAHALAWPERIDSGVEFLDLLKVGRLDLQRLTWRSSAASRWRRRRAAPVACIRSCSRGQRGCGAGVPGAQIELSRHRGGH